MSLYDLGQTGGSDTVTLLQSEIPSHGHALRANPQTGDTPAPASNAALARPGTINAFQTTIASNLAPMASESLPPAGGGQPHNNLQPYLTVHFCIALQGIFPPRS